ncbi:UPF0053 inner membrane protein YfjD [Candidatus Vallotia tarda]|uniref:UPF0053 inner membrane protein YfjD n=2 Tax=Candidatus Vallotiella hemipterorum TaxID=1177213 RepID=A0A916JSN8_9BURK|nr:UPF0053 inner membrane protein YfjD [Candidatus Vallotia tarda]
MMSLNRHQLKELAVKEVMGAKTTQRLLAHTDQLLCVILIGNNLINVIIPVLTTSIALRAFRNHSAVLSITTGIVAFLIIVFAEITPKIVGAAFPEKIALPASLVIKPLITIARPLIWFINLLTNSILFILHINMKRSRDLRMSNEEWRSVVLESSNFIPSKHKSILLNLFNLENISVDDVMTPRQRIEALDFNMPFDQLVKQLETCYHNQLVVYRGDIDRVLGMLHVRKILAALQNQKFRREKFRELLVEPYFVPSGTPVFQQLQYFQENQNQMALVVNEYGEIQGLVTLEDIIKELIGEFTTTLPRIPSGIANSWNAQGECIVTGGTSLRELNRRLGLRLPLDGPKTLNGLILELLESIPEADVSLVISNTRIQVMQIDNQAIRTVKLFRPSQLDSIHTAAV